MVVAQRACCGGSSPWGDLRTNHPSQARRRGFVAHLTGTNSGARSCVAGCGGVLSVTAVDRSGDVVDATYGRSYVDYATRQWVGISVVRSSRAVHSAAMCRTT